MIPQIAQEDTIISLKQTKSSEINLEIGSPTKQTNPWPNPYRNRARSFSITPTREEDESKLEKVNKNVSEDKVKISTQRENAKQVSDIITSLLVDVSNYSIKRIRSGINWHGLISTFLDVENQETGNVNSLLMIFTKFPCEHLGLEKYDKICINYVE